VQVNVYIQFICGDPLILKFRVNMQVWSALTGKPESGSKQLLDYLPYLLLFDGNISAVKAV
jgi:hypothetical protein